MKKKLRKEVMEMWQTTKKQIESLKQYEPSYDNKPQDFREFWEEEKQYILQQDVNASVEWIDFPSKTVDVGEIMFTSWDGTPLKGIIIKPKHTMESDILWSFHGLTGSRGLPTDFFKWTTLGLTVISFDVRGQGDSPDYAKYLNGARTQAWILKGILDPKEHYYTNIYRDMILQAKWIQEQSYIQPKKIGVIGSSQGGAISTVAAGLMSEMIDFAMIDCPFMTYIEKSVTAASTGSYANIKDYCKINVPQVEDTFFILETLSYVDTVYFGEFITCPVIMSIGLLDTTTPSIGVYALYHSLQANVKTIDAYPRFEHEIVPFHELKKFEFVYEQIK